MFGIVSAARSLAQPADAEDGRARFLIALHDAARAGFWLTLGGFFLVYGVANDPYAFRWVAIVPVGMAALRLLAAMLLWRS